MNVSASLFACRPRSNTLAACHDRRKHVRASLSLAACTCTPCTGEILPPITIRSTSLALRHVRAIALTCQDGRDPRLMNFNAAPARSRCRGRSRSWDDHGGGASADGGFFRASAGSTRLAFAARFFPPLRPIARAAADNSASLGSAAIGGFAVPRWLRILSAGSPVGAAGSPVVPGGNKISLSHFIDAGLFLEL